MRTLSHVLATVHAYMRIYPMSSESRSYYLDEYEPEPQPLVREFRLKKLEKIFSKIRNKTLLDVACSDGRIGIVLAKAMGADEVYGVDVSRRALKEAAGLSINTVRCDLAEKGLPFAGDSFGVVYAGEVIEHLFNPSHLIEEIKRVLKPGGKCIFTTPNLASWTNSILLLAGFQPYLTDADFKFGGIGKVERFRQLNKPGEHIRAFTQRSLKELLTLQGFEIAFASGAAMSLPEPITLLKKILNKLNNLMSMHSSWADIQIICAIKPNEPQRLPKPEKGRTTHREN